LTRQVGDIVDAAPLLWRVHRTAGRHALPWNALRRYGPLISMRYDSQPPPPGLSTEGVLYAAADLPTALAEVFQTTRLIDTVSFRPHLTAWTPVRNLRLIDLTSDWALRNGASYALAAAPRSTGRAWSRAIRTAWPDLDGLWAPSTMTGQTSAILFNPAADALPPLPGFSRALAEPVIRTILRRIADDLAYALF
jgi:hypothetical protein